MTPTRRMVGADVTPYRVEWRHNLTTRWLLMGNHDTRKAADETAARAVARYGGYCRVIAQYTIAASDRAGDWTSAP